MLKPGEIFETAMWVDGRETSEQLARFESDLKEQLDYFAEQEGVVIGPLNIIEKRPGEERVPQVPDDIQGPNVRLLVGEAKVLCNKPVFAKNVAGFVNDLEADDLARLRLMTRNAYASHFPSKPRLTDYQCDEIINTLGPDAALEALRSSETFH